MLACIVRDALSVPYTWGRVLHWGTAGIVGRVDWEDWCAHNPMAIWPGLISVWEGTRADPRGQMGFTVKYFVRMPVSEKPGALRREAARVQRAQG